MAFIYCVLAVLVAGSTAVQPDHGEAPVRRARHHIEANEHSTVRRTAPVRRDDANSGGNDRAGTQTGTVSMGTWTVTRYSPTWANAGTKVNTFCGRSTDTFSVQCLPLYTECFAKFGETITDHGNSSEGQVLVNQDGTRVTGAWWCCQQARTELLGTPTFVENTSCNIRVLPRGSICAPNTGITKTDCQLSNYRKTFQGPDPDLTFLELSSSETPTGCMHVPANLPGTDDAFPAGQPERRRRRRQVRWNTGTADKPNADASPLCWANPQPTPAPTIMEAACRLDEQDQSYNGALSRQSGSGGDPTTCIEYPGRNMCPTMTLEACKSHCTSRGTSCTGIEWRMRDGRCETWSQPIGYKKPAGGYLCISKPW